MASYVHNAVVDGKGKIGVLVGLESSKAAVELKTLGMKSQRMLRRKSMFWISIR